MTAPDRPCQTPPVDGDAKRWWQEPRWKGKPPPPSAEWSQQRTRAAADRRHTLIVGDDAGNKTAHGIELARCASGSGIVAGWRSGEFFAFPLEQRRGDVQIPVGAKWNLRGKRVELLGVVAGAMIGDGGRDGLVATLDELGAILELRRTQVGDYVHELLAWGLLDVVPVHAPFGRVHVRRANCYRITKLAAFVYRLVVRVQLPDPRAVTPRRKRVRRPAQPPACAPVYGPEYVRSRARELPIGNPDANPENPVPGYSSGEPAALPGEIDGPPAPPGAALVCPGPVPDAATVLNTARRVKSRPEALGSRGPVSTNGRDRSVATVLRDVRRGHVDYTPTMVRQARAPAQRERDRLAREREDADRQRQLAEQLARRQREALQRLNPPQRPEAPILTDEELEQMRRRDRELAAARARKRSGIPDDDIVEIAERTWKNRGVDTTAGELGHALWKLKRDRDGGAS